MSPESLQVVSCDPETIWPLEEQEKAVAVPALVRECAKQFQEAVRNDDADLAQDLAIGALGAMGGLFPDANDPVHELLQSLMGMIVGAKFGRSNHILGRSTSPIVGTKMGLGHALIGAFAVSAVRLLLNVGLPARSARQCVADMLAAQGVSLRTDDHGQPKPITEGAIRNWYEKPKDYPLQTEMAADMAAIHARNLPQQQAATLNDVLAYVRGQVPEMVTRSRAL